MPAADLSTSALVGGDQKHNNDDTRSIKSNEVDIDSSDSEATRVAQPFRQYTDPLIRVAMITGEDDDEIYHVNAGPGSFSTRAFGSNETDDTKEYPQASSERDRHMTQQMDEVRSRMLRGGSIILDRALLDLDDSCPYPFCLGFPDNAIHGGDNYARIPSPAPHNRLAYHLRCLESLWDGIDFDGSLPSPLVLTDFTLAPRLHEGNRRNVPRSHRLCTHIRLGAGHTSRHSAAIRLWLIAAKQQMAGLDSRAQMAATIGRVPAIPDAVLDDGEVSKLERQARIGKVMCFSRTISQVLDLVNCV